VSSKAKQERPHRLGLILTGGTIGSAVSSPGSEEKLVRLLDGAGSEIPELELIWKATPRAGDFEFSVRRPIGLLSENLVPKDWIPMASTIRDLVQDDGVEAVLVLHGTDTMSYTSAAMAFMLAELPVPIVLTGANKPSDQVGSDAFQNIRDSLTALRELEPGVFIVFAGRPKVSSRMHLGTRVRKVRASGYAFESVGRRPVGEVRNGKVKRFWTPEPSTPVPSRIVVDSRVLSLRLYPGLDLMSVFDSMVQAKIRGVVLELYPSFTGPTGRSRFSASRFVKACTARDIPVVAAVANEPAGKLNLYESRIGLEAAGAQVLHMLPETATVKLMWALGARRKRQSVLDLMSTQIANEMAS
jgi:L-asparaginase/Glu-tRNA(Gln) amidotransferase subunit D